MEAGDAPFRLPDHFLVFLLGGGCGELAGGVGEGGAVGDGS